MRYNNNYYLIAVHGDDCEIIGEPKDIACIDLETMFNQKEDYIKEIYEYLDITIPKNADICIARYTIDKNGIERFKCFDPIFTDSSTTKLKSRMEALLARFANQRLKKIENHEKKITIEDTEKIELPKEDGTTLEAGFEVYVYSFVQSLISNYDTKKDFLKSCTLISEHLKKYLWQENPLESFNYQKLLEDLKQYTEARSLYLEYANYLDENHTLINKNRAEYLRPFKSALKRKEKEKMTHITTNNKTQELVDAFNKGEISYEEMEERIDSNNLTRSIGLKG